MNSFVFTTSFFQLVGEREESQTMGSFGNSSSAGGTGSGIFAERDSTNFGNSVSNSLSSSFDGMSEIRYQRNTHKRRINKIKQKILPTFNL